MVKNYSRFSEVELGYWDFFDRLYDNKVSASDLGKKELLRIMDTEIKMIGDDEDEEELWDFSGLQRNVRARDYRYNPRKSWN